MQISAFLKTRCYIQGFPAKISHHISSTNENLCVATDKFAYHAFVANMNKKRFTEFSNYLEGFTQRIVERFSKLVGKKGIFSNKCKHFNESLNIIYVNSI